MSDKRIPSTRTGIQFLLVLVAVVLVLGFVQVTGDRPDERTALQMILADLETDSVELTAQLNRGHTTERAVLYLLRNVDQELPPDSVIAGITPLYFYTTYEQVRAGYLNLLYAGRLTVISNPELRQSVVDYFERTHPYMWQFHAMYMDVYREFKETTAPYIRFVPEPEGEVLVQSFHTELVRPWAEMRADIDFLYKVEELGAIGSQFGIRLGPALERNAELRGAIRQELGL